MRDITYTPNHPNTGGWKDRHLAAVNNPNMVRGTGGAVILALKAWILYAKAHEQRFESPIGQDYVLGPAWARWGAAVRELLNGELGPLDAGSLDTIIHDNLTEQGFDPDNIKR